MRTIKAEVEQILVEIDKQFRLAFCGTQIADIGLAQLAFTQLLEQAKVGASIEEMMDDIFAGVVKMPIPQEYLKHFLKTCAHSAAAIHHQESNNVTGAWQQVCDAKAEAGCALAIFVSSSELKNSQNEESKMLSEAGKIGADIKNNRTRLLKEWALKKAEKMKGEDKKKAKDLSALIPIDLADASKDPQRFIYDALREQDKQKKKTTRLAGLA